jgi:DNA mismatch endonuclease, patch repair protein
MKSLAGRTKYLGDLRKRRADPQACKPAPRVLRRETCVFTARSLLLREVLALMADIFSKTKRSRVMAAVRSGGNRDTELKLVRILRENRITGWRRHVSLPGQPDFVFWHERLVVFVDGCFWHSCPLHGTKPASNSAYWIPKLARNRARDLAVTRELRRKGWQVLRIWEHALREPAKVVLRCRRAMKRPKF